MKHGKELPVQLVAQLKKGMTRIEVDRLLGTPATTTPYGQNEWVYIYSYSETWSKFGDGALQTDEKNLTIYFDNNNRVKDFTTNYL